MSDYVWVSDAMTKRVVLGISAEMNVEVEDHIRAVDLNDSGKPVPSDICPTRIWEGVPIDDYGIQIGAGLPDLCFAKGYWLVSERAANVMMQFDLGGGDLYPVSDGLYFANQKTRVPGNYYCWIFGNKKQAFLPDETPNKRKFGIAGIMWNLPYSLEDGDIAVARTALVGPDVWLDDNLVRAIFMSGPLGDALAAAELCKPLCLYKARVA